MSKGVWMLGAALALALGGACAAGAQTAPAEPGAAASAPAGVAAAAPVTGGSYLVQPDDTLQITVWGEESIQGVYLNVTPQGVVNAPVVGSVQAGGRTIDDIRKEISGRFVSMGILNDPVVQLTLYQMHKMKVRVLGQVQRPGLQLMREGDSIDQAVAEAGGFIVDSAGLARTTVTREGASEPMKIDLQAYFFGGDLSQNVKLKDGDTIYIPEDTENKFYVVGYVQRPQPYPLKPTTTVTEAITQAGGAITRGSLARTVIIRKGAEGKPSERIPVDVAKIVSTGDTSGDMKLRPGDVVYVPETKAPDLSRIGQALGALANAAWLSRTGF